MMTMVFEKGAFLEYLQATIVKLKERKLYW